MSPTAPGHRVTTFFQNHSNQQSTKQTNKQTSPQAKRHKLSLHSLFKLPWILSKYNFYHHILIFIILFIHFIHLIHLCSFSSTFIVQSPLILLFQWERKIRFYGMGFGIFVMAALRYSFKTSVVFCLLIGRNPDDNSPFSSKTLSGLSSFLDTCACHLHVQVTCR